MPDTLPPKRAALRERLLDTAEAQIASGGIVALRARDLATEAGCALGAIYSVFSDLGDIAVAINRRSLEQMTGQMAASVRGLDDEAPTDRLITLAQAYLDYAESEGHRWRTIFSIGLSSSNDEPGFDQAIAPIIALFAAPLAELSLKSSASKTDTAARTLFAAVHGLITLGLEPRLAVLERRKLEKRIARVVTALASDEDTL